MSDLNAREAALKKINDALMAAKQAAEARVAELEAELAKAPRGRFGRRGPDPRVAEVEAENEALRARVAALEQAPPAPPPLEQPPPEPEATPAALLGRPTLPQLEELVAQAARSGRPEAEEWSIYLPLLREHALPDGTIPPQFDDVLRDVFGSWA